MRTPHKILVTVFLLLILVSVGEIIYYIFIVYRQNTTITKQKALATMPSPTIVLKKSITPALDRDLLYNFAYYQKKGTITSSIVTNKHEGKILRLFFSEGSAPYYLENGNILDYHYKWGFDLSNDNNVFDIFRFSESDSKKVTVFRVENNNLLQIKIEDLKVGNHLSIEETRDLTKDFFHDLVSAKIIQKM